MASINNSINRSTGVKPASVTYKNAHDIWLKLYGQPPRQKATHFRFPVGTKVRISKYKKVFDKGYIPTFTRELFVVTEHVHRDLPVYRLMDLNGKKISGVFYENELIRVKEKKNEEFKIEEVLKERKRNGKKQYFVKWLGYDHSFNSWVSDVHNLK